MLGFLMQWPTLLTLLMFPVLVVMYVRLGRIEEREAQQEFADQYRAYMQRVPAFIARFGSRREGVRSGAGANSRGWARCLQDRVESGIRGGHRPLVLPDDRGACGCVRSKTRDRARV